MPPVRPDFQEHEEDVQTLFLDSDPVMSEALTALRESVIEPESTSAFEIAVTRQWRHENGIRSSAFWLPVLLGAAASLVAFMMLYQLIFSFGPDSTPAQKPADMQVNYSDPGSTQPPR